MLEFGDNAGKLVTIVDVIDQNRALVDGTPVGVPRQAVQFKRLRLTKFCLPLSHGASSTVVKKLYAAEDIDNKFAATALAKRLQQRELVYYIIENNIYIALFYFSYKQKSTLTDFDRFKLYKAKQQVSYSTTKLI